MNGFTQVLNDLITDRRIGATAFRVASYLASKPSGWIPREADVCQVLGISRATYFRARKELAEAGYMTRPSKPRKTKTGQIRTDAPKLVASKVSPVRLSPSITRETLNNTREIASTSEKVSPVRLAVSQGPSSSRSEPEPKAPAGPGSFPTGLCAPDLLPLASVPKAPKVCALGCGVVLPSRALQTDKWIGQHMTSYHPEKLVEFDTKGAETL